MELYYGQERKVCEGLNLSVDFSELGEIASKGLLSLSVQLGIKVMMKNSRVGFKKV